MTTVRSQSTARTRCAEQAAPSAWDALRAHLEGLKRDLLREIEHYPPPIPACDAQFNYLLQRRDALSQELQRLAEVQADRPTGTQSLAAWEAFVAACEFIDAQTAESLRARLAP